MTNIINTIHSRDFSNMVDEELVTCIQKGDSEAFDFLIQKYRKLVFMKTRSYFIIGADREDIIQEGMIGLFKAVRDYKNDRLYSFKSFAELFITRQVITAIKAATRKKHLPLNSYVSLYRPIHGEDSNSTLMDIVGGSKTLDPQELVINQEENVKFRIEIIELFTELEREVLFLYLDGHSYKEISFKLSSHVKAIDNALTRIKRKLEKYLNGQDWQISEYKLNSVFDIKNLNLSNRNSY